MSPILKQPTRSARAAQILALVGTLLAACVSDARADDSPRNPLEALVPYDLEGTRTLQALTLLRDQAPMKADPRERRELEFVRAVALSDLWLIGQQLQNVALLDGVAKVAGVARADVPELLTRALGQIDDPVVSDIVLDARQALLATTLQQEQAARVPIEPVGLRSEAVLVHAVAGALTGTGDKLEALSALASDPCAGADKACAPLYASFDAQGRKAVHALSDGLAALQHLRTSRSRDPFLEAIAAQIARDTIALNAADLSPRTRLPAGATRAHTTQLGSMTAPDLVMLVSEGRAELGFSPRVHVSAGIVTLYARGEPMLPATQQVAFSATFPAFVKSVPELVAVLSPLLAQTPDATIAIGAAPQAPAHLWARALLSAQAVRFPRIALLGVDANEVVRSLAVEVVSALRAAEVGPSDLNVVVRLGGFTVRQGGPGVTIPRVRKEEGFAFDFDALLQNAKPADAKSVKLTFMSEVAADTLAETAFAVAPSNSALTVVLP